MSSCSRRTWTREAADTSAAGAAPAGHELVLVDRGTTAKAATALSRRFGLEVRRVFWPDKSRGFRPLPYAWRVEVAHGMLGPSRHLAKSLENTTSSASGWLQAACVALLLRELTAPGT